MTDKIDPAAWPSYLHPAVEQMNELLELEPGWNSYKAPAIQWEACVEALHVLRALRDAPSVLPVVVPTSKGGIELRWDGANGDVLLEFDPAKPWQFGFVVAVEEWRDSRAFTPLPLFLTWVEARKD